MRRCAAVVQAFFPGEEGAGAVAGVLSGRINPSGRLPVSMPRSAGAQPYTYLHVALGEGDEVTNLDSTPAAPFGFGLSYTTFAYGDLAVPEQVPTDGWLTVSARVTNTGSVAGDDVVQLYGRDVLGSVTRPVAQLLGYQRVHLLPGRSATIRFMVPTGRLAFTDRRYSRVVEPGEVELWIGTSARREIEARTVLVGPTWPITVASPRRTRTELTPADQAIADGVER
jgi:beta-xylosidase